MVKTEFARIIIDPDVEHSPLAASIRRNARNVEVTVQPTAEFAAGTRHLSLTEGKRLLLLRPFRGRAVKLCQGWKPDYACCNLHTVAEANNCAMECTYCILQFYVNSPHMTVFGNIDDLQDEITRMVRREPDRLLRIGTGELSDSLLLDPLTESTTHMVPFFRRLPHAVLELKTKTDNIGHLLGMDGGERVVVSWSVNPQEIVTREELKTASLADRLAAARQVAEHGYPVGFHLDPMVHYDGWREGYAALVDHLIDAVPVERIAWISLGSLRFPPQMKATMTRRFPRSELPTGELIRADDGKFHYLRPLRLEMYRLVVERLNRRLDMRPRARWGEARERRPVLYLCMEPPAVWKKVFGKTAPTNAELEFEFAANYSRRFPRAGLPAPELQRYEAFAAATARAQADGTFVSSDSLQVLGNVE